MNQPPLLLSRLYAILLAILPWSIDFQVGTWNLIVPAEPVLCLTAIVLAYSIYQNGLPSSFGLLISGLYLGWVGIAAVLSTDMVVSVKYGVIMCLHWWVFAVGFSRWPSLFRQQLPYFIFSLAGGVVFTLAHHGYHDFRADQAILAPMPFFSDHTNYAAVLAMAIMAFWVLPFPNRWRLVALAILTTGLVFSHCRAAIGSAIIAATVLWVSRFTNPRFWAIAVLTIAIPLSLALAFYPGIIANNNIFTPDVSITERLNRYAAAGRMAVKKPMTGFGPGTYQVAYIPFQKKEEMTRISAQVPIFERNVHTYGRGGGAHSEYLQVLSETGWIGFGIYTWMLGYLLLRNLPPNGKIASLMDYAPLVILIVFITHGVVNNLFHDARIALLFWGGAFGYLSQTKE